MRCLLFVELSVLSCIQKPFVSIFNFTVGNLNLFENFDKPRLGLVKTNSRRFLSKTRTCKQKQSVHVIVSVHPCHHGVMSVCWRGDMGRQYTLPVSHASTDIDTATTAVEGRRGNIDKISGGVGRIQNGTNMHRYSGIYGTQYTRFTIINDQVNYWQSRYSISCMFGSQLLTGRDLYVLTSPTDKSYSM